MTETTVPTTAETISETPIAPEEKKARIMRIVKIAAGATAIFAAGYIVARVVTADPDEADVDETVDEI